MLKQKTKLMLILFFIIILITTISFADNEVTTINKVDTNVTTEDTTTQVNTNTSTSENNIYQGDLYLTGSDVKMDKLVNGNVYIFGNNVNITGQIAGNLYVCGGTVTFDKAYIQSSVYIFAQSVKFSAISNDLYVACENLEIPSNFGVYRDLKVGAKNIYISGIIGRDAYINSQTISLEKDSAKASIYGNLNYTSKSEINIPEGSVTGKVNFSKFSNTKNSSIASIKDYIFSALKLIILVLVIFLILNKFAKNFLENVSIILTKKWYLALLFGLLALILVPIISILLAISIVCLPLAGLLLIIYGLLLLISSSLVCIVISKLVNNKFNITKKSLQIASLALIALILWGINLIPYVGPIVSIIVLLLGYGTCIMSIFKKNN